MYGVLLAVHNITRWLVLLAAIWALVRVYSGLVGQRAWVRADATAGRVFGGLLSLQVVIGLVLYVLPGGTVQSALGSIGAVMQNRDLRFFVVEHLTVMLVALGLVHIGTARARRAPEDRAKFRRAALWYTLTTLAIIVAIPWWRPLLRLG